MLFIDVDEFVAFPIGDHLAAPLNGLALKYPAEVFCLPWVTMTPEPPYDSPTERRPADSLLTEVIQAGSNRNLKGKVAVHTAMFSPDQIKLTSFIGKKTPTWQGYFHNPVLPDGMKSRSVDGRLIESRICDDPDAKKSTFDTLSLYHYFSRTCYEWRCELVPKRFEHHTSHINSDLARPRIDPTYCTQMATETLHPAQNLQRFSQRLRQRVSRHPLWGHDISFFEPTEDCP
jgi:hypothetical protein